MTDRPKILITNDDGIYAPGIRQLFEAISSFADVTIVAPASEQSAQSLSITIHHPLRIEKVDWPEPGKAWSVSGTPADCVKLANSVLLKEKPDLLLSGINRGSNAGRNIFYSGTVAGAIEGIMQDIPSIAFSCYDLQGTDYKLATPFIIPIVNYVINHPLPKGTLLNVNFPTKTHGPIKGFRMTRHGKQFWGDNPDERLHPHENSSYYWLGAKLVEFEEDEDTDISWLQKGYATAVPIHVGELTDHLHIESHRDSFEKAFSTKI